MFFVRESRPDDLSAVRRVAAHLDSYNLPADRAALKALLALSDASFSGRVAAPLRKYLFVAEEAASGRVVGCSLILARHGTPRLPHLSFRVGAEERRSRSLDRRLRHVTLKLSADRKGFTEVGGLALLPEHRRGPERVGRLLSYARFLFMASRPADFLRRLLVEYQAPVDPRTGNKLWEYIGQHFTGLTYREADRLSATDKEFILALFPRDKIYASVLPYSAQRTIGRVSSGAEASRRLLERQSFRYCGQVDPFDGGPHYTTSFRSVPLIRRARERRVGDPAAFRAGRVLPGYILSPKERGVRVVWGEPVVGTRIHLDGALAAVLKVQPGDRVIHSEATA